jgi:hypothetical protein
MELYGLQPLADKVAGIDPVTGEKKKLPESYGHFLTSLSGKNEVVPRPRNSTQPYEIDRSEQKLQWLSEYPQDEWQSSHVKGKELSLGLDMEKLKGALSGITKGPIPGVRPSKKNLFRDHLTCVVAVGVCTVH